MPKYTKQELRVMARETIRKLESNDILEQSKARRVILQTALKTGRSLVRTKIAIRNLAI